MGEFTAQRTLASAGRSPSRCCPQHSPVSRRPRAPGARGAGDLRADPPNICTLFDVGHQDGTDYLVMEYLEGTTLADRLALGPLPLDEARRIAAQVACALAMAHERGIVHRDLKPGNIMLTKGGVDRPGASQVKLLDFGLAKLREPDTEDALRSSVATRQALTAQGSIVGTIPYMAPEQMAARSSTPAATSSPSARCSTKW